MKIRNSFVSNSSSCSFILVGFSKDDLSETFIKRIEEKYEDGLFDFAIENGVGYYGEEELLGYTLAEGGSDGDPMSENEFSISDLIDKVDKLSTLFEISTSKIKLITGERCC